MNSNADKLFNECVKDAQAQAEVLIHQVINNVMDTFEAHAIDAVTSRDRQRYHDLLIELRRSKMALSRNFLSQFNGLVASSMQAKEGGADSFQYVDLDNITLMDDDSMQEDVEVSQLIQQIEAKAEWEIRDLNSRMSALKGSGVLDPKHNPMRPELFGRSLQRAVQSVPIGGEERLVMLRSFGTALSTALKATYASYSRKLQARNVLPMQYGVRPARNPQASLQAARAMAQQAQALQGMTQPMSAPQSASQQPANAHPADAQFHAPVGAAHLHGYTPEQIEKLMRGVQLYQSMRPVAESMTSEGGPSSFFGGTSSEALKSTLHKVMRAEAEQPVEQSATNLITQFREELVSAAQRPIERLTIDVVAMMFDQILADGRLLVPVKAALGRLQIPVLRMALADASLFSSRQHPTRKLINRVASYSLGYSQEGDPNFRLFMNAVNAEVEMLAADESEESDHYVRSLENIELVITQINEETRRASDEAVKLLERAELRTVMRNSIAHHLATVMASAEVPDYLRDFMLTQWALVLVECILVNGEAADVTLHLKQTASDLIWSVQPKVTTHDRQHLVKILPQLVRQVREGLSLVEWADFALTDQQKFFAQLMSSHAKAVKAEPAPRSKSRTAADGSAQAWQEKVAQAWGGTLELDSPSALGEVVVAAVEKNAAALIDTADISSAPSDPSEQLVMPAAAEADASPQQLQQAEADHAQDMAGRPEFEASRPPMDFSPSRPSVVAALPEKLSVDALEVGTWYEMKLHGDWNRVQLFWKSPKNLFFMFNSNVGGKSHSITRRALEKLCVDNNLRNIEAESLIDRVVADVMASAEAVKEGHSLIGNQQLDAM